MTDESFLDFLNDDSDLLLNDTESSDDFDLDSLLADFSTQSTKAPGPSEDDILASITAEFSSKPAPKPQKPAAPAKKPIPASTQTSVSKKPQQPPIARKEKPAPVAPPKRKAVEEELPPNKFLDGIAKHRFVINLCLSVLAIVLLGGIVGLFWLQSNADPYDGKIIPNIRIAGIDVGGLTPSEATQKVTANAAELYAKSNMIVYLGSKQLVLTPANTHAKLNVDGAVNAAYEFGRTGSSADRQAAYHEAQVSPLDIDLVPFLGLNEEYIRSMLRDAAQSISDVFEPSSYTLEGTRPDLDADSFDAYAPCQTLVFKIGRPGSNANLDGIYNEVMHAYTCSNFRTEISRQNLPEMPEEFDLDEIHRELSIDPVEAVEVPGTKEVVSGSCGYTFSVEDAKLLLSTAEYGDTVSIQMEYVKPNVLDIRGDYPELLGTYSTPLSNDKVYNQNISILCKELDGTVIDPGTTFSFNNSMPTRTEANGFGTTTAHGKYCLTQEIGGGADQVATTLYVSALCANLNILQRADGDHACGYCIRGTELSVRQPWQDLKITNSGTEAVIIRAKATDTNLVIRILGKTPPKYNVKIESEAGYVAPIGTTNVEKKSGEGFTDGQVLVEGLAGGSIQLFRVEYDKNTNEQISKKSICYVNVPNVNQQVVKIR